MLEDYWEDLPYEVVSEHDAGRGLMMQRVALEDEDAYHVDIVLVGRYLRLEAKVDGSDAQEFNWDGRTTLYDPDVVESLGRELVHAADWIREQEASNG